MAAIALQGVVAQHVEVCESLHGKNVGVWAVYYGTQQTKEAMSL